LLPKILFRADSGINEGYGHRTRVEALAKFVETQGFDYRIVSKKNKGARPDIPDLNRILWLQEKIVNANDKNAIILDAKNMIEIAELNDFSPDIIIVDSYKLGTSWESYLKSQGYYVVALDDFGGKQHEANLIVEFVPPPCSIDRICGLEFIPVDPLFKPSSIDLPSNSWNVLISFGGTDLANHTELVLIALDQICKNISNLINEIHVILPQASCKNKEICDRFSNNKKIFFYTNLPSLASLMHKCEVVITSGGNTMIESIVAKRPCLVVITAKNQSIVAEYLANHNVINLLGYATDVSVTQIIHAFINLPKIFKNEMSKALKFSKIDFNGSERLLSVVYSKWKSERYVKRA
jgi:spore coat polysaccharide biosynthesis predicted glycosyltransferase SpsG